MADKQALNATFFVFKKRERGVLLGATIAYVLASIAISGAFVALNWGAVADYIGWVTSMSAQMQTYDPNNPYANMPPASVMSLGPAYLLFMFASYLLLAAYEAACLKWMIHGEAGGFFGLSRGADTWRVWAGYWLWFVLLIVAYMICGIIAVIFMGSLFAAMGASGDPSAAASLGIAAPILFLLVLLGAIYFAVRFAPAAATSIARRRFSFFDAWTVSKGRFWELLGSFAMLFVMYFVAVMIFSVGIVVAIGMSAASIAMDPNATPEQGLAALSKPEVLIPVAVIYLLIIIVAFVWMLAMFGVNARAAQIALEEGKIKPAA